MLTSSKKKLLNREILRIFGENIIVSIQWADDVIY
jgi:hypothetical protein